MKSISIEEIENILANSNGVVIDIRDNYIYQLGSIPGAINIPSNFLAAMPEKYLDRNKKYYLLCEYGITSQKLVKILEPFGYDVTSIQGGYRSYHS